MSRRQRRAVGGSAFLFALTLLISASSVPGWDRTASADDDDVRTRVLYLLLVDTSVSMREKPEGRDETKMATVRRVLGEFTQSLPTETDIYLATFNEGLKRQWRRRILGDVDRQALAELVKGMRPVGSATHAWPSLAEMLSKAKEWLAENPRGEVRLFMYTDGEDNSGQRLDTVLAPYRDLLTSEEVRASFYTLGFTLRKGLPEALEKLGIRVRAVPDLSDLAPPLTAHFDWSPSRPGKGTRVVFRDRSTGWIKTYRWSFGDGSSSSDKAPAHAYQSDGRFTVTLAVTDSTGQSDSTARSVVILRPAAPVVDFFVGATSAERGAPIAFVERCQGAVEDFRWDFGDGTTGTGPNVEHAWKEAGEYPVRLTVKGPDGESFASEPKSVRIVAPKAPGVELVVPQEGVPLGTTLRFIADVTGQVDQVEWDLGDGTTSKSRYPEHEYTQPGEYKIVLTATGPGGTQTTEATITVLPPEKPVAGFSIGTTEPRVGQPVRFTNTSTGTVDRVGWNFGDGGSSAQDSPEHAFTKPGTYTVTLEVAGAGETSETSETLEVIASNEPPAAAFTWHLGAKYGAMDLRLENQTTGSASGFTWNFGDGSDPVRTNEHGDVSHHFEPGTYDVTLIAHGAEGYADSRTSRSVEVPHPPTFVEKYWWALLIALIVLILIARKVMQGIRESREAVEATYIAGQLEVLDEDSGEWHTLGSTDDASESVTELSVSAQALGDVDGQRIDRVVVRIQGEAYVADVYAGGTSPIQIALVPPMPGSPDYEGAWDRFIFRFRE